MAHHEAGWFIFAYSAIKRWCKVIIINSFTTLLINGWFIMKAVVEIEIRRIQLTSFTGLHFQCMCSWGAGPQTPRSHTYATEKVKQNVANDHTEFNKVRVRWENMKFMIEMKMWHIYIIPDPVMRYENVIFNHRNLALGASGRNIFKTGTGTGRMRRLQLSRPWPYAIMICQL